MTVDGISVAMLRVKKKLTITNFDTDVLTDAGVDFEYRDGSEYFDGDFVVVAGTLSDETYVRRW